MKKVMMIMAVLAAFMMTGCGVEYASDSNNQTTTTTTDSHDVVTGFTDGNESTSGEETVMSGDVVDSNSTLEVPTFSGNSQGKLVVQCEDDIVYYIMAYDCLKPDTKPSVTVSGGEQVVDEELVHVGEVFYTSGHIERTGGAVTVTGHVYSGGVTLPQTWVETCE